MLIGLTGGIGSGKTAAANHFESLGIDVVDADLASRAVVEPGQPALESIAEHFGESIIAANGGLDRAQLRKLVFAEESERKWLQRLLHPLISEYLAQQIKASASTYCLLVNPLLLESGQSQWCTKIIVVDTPVETQIQRTMARDDNNREQVQSIVNAQMSREDRLSAADFVLLNDQGINELKNNVENIHRELVDL
jgi:dephospho-CoA kinase|tara:strand:+ start:29 stop:613 length:585 start_codon:yes stop_codon:yes gene_type:complete